MLDLIGNTENRFSQVGAHGMAADLTSLFYSYTCMQMD